MAAMPIVSQFALNVYSGKGLRFLTGMRPCIFSRIEHP